MRSVLAALVLLALPLDVAADTAAVLAPGARVRLKAPSVLGTAPRAGRLVASDAQELLIAIDGVKAPVTVPRDAIARLDVRTSRRSRGVNALLGAGLAASLGAAIGLISGDDDPGFLSFSAGDKAAIGAILGAPVGALVGAALPPSERWETVSLAKMRPGMTTTGSRGAGISLSFSF